MILTLRLTPEEDHVVEQLKQATGQSAASKAVMMAAGSFVQLGQTVERQRAELETLRREFAEYRQVVMQYKAARADFDRLGGCSCGADTLPDMNVCPNCI